MLILKFHYRYLELTKEKLVDDYIRRLQYKKVKSEIDKSRSRNVYKYNMFSAENEIKLNDSVKEINVIKSTCMKPYSYNYLDSFYVHVLNYCCNNFMNS